MNKPTNPSSASIAPPPAQSAGDKSLTAFENASLEVFRALKKARSFERQRVGKKMNDEKKNSKKRQPKNSKNNVDPAELLQRLELELEILKHINLEVTARVTLANVMLRAKTLSTAEGPLPVFLQRAAQRPATTTQEQGWPKERLHSVTSALCGRPMVREAVDKAVRDMCDLLGVEVPLKHQTKKQQQKARQEGKQNGNQNGKRPREEESEDEEEAEDEDEDEGGDRMAVDSKQPRPEESDDDDDDDDDDDEEEKALSKYDALLGGSSDDEDGDFGNLSALKAVAKAAVAAEGGEEEEEEFMGFSDREDEGGNKEDSKDDDDEDDDDEEDDDDKDSSSDEELRPAKRRATAAAAGQSAFIPALMGGYVSDGSDGDSDSENRRREDELATKMLAAPRKNRRGQRARQLIAERKFKAQAKHLQGKSGRFDAKRIMGDAPVWQQRQRLREVYGRIGGPVKSKAEETAATKPATKKDDEGPLHPSWEAAKKAKEMAQTAEFQGKKIVFD